MESDLSQKLDRLLSSPDGMKKIGEMMALFGAGAADTDGESPPQEPPPEPPHANSAPPPAEESPFDLGALLKLLPLLGQFKQEDDSTALLRALRPHLANERQKRLDESVQLLRIYKLLPLLRELQGKGDGFL